MYLNPVPLNPSRNLRGLSALGQNCTTGYADYTSAQIVIPPVKDWLCPAPGYIIPQGTVWMSGRNMTKYQCCYPAAAPAPAPAANITVTVPTTTTTTVSPQVSPVLVQQDEPTGSPVTAGTQQQQPSSGMTEYLQFLRERDAIESERRQRDAELRAQEESERDRLLQDFMSQSQQAPSPEFFPQPIYDEPAASSTPSASGGGHPGIDLPLLPGTHQQLRMTPLLIAVMALGAALVLSKRKRAR